MGFAIADFQLRSPRNSQGQRVKKAKQPQVEAIWIRMVPIEEGSR